jgi:mRNA-degrading endonuclease RelE of RelBE toxin-antitoxin system
MIIWQIRAPENFSKYLEDLPTNERKAFDQIVLDLGDSTDPRRLADEYVLTRRHGRVYTVRLSKSYRLAFRVYFREKILEMVSVGDHKDVYGKD